MSVVFYILSALLLCISVLVGLAAPSDIQLTMAAVFFGSAVISFGVASVLAQAKSNAESLARIEHYLASKEEDAERGKR